MLQAYIDGSGTGEPTKFVLAGYLSTAEAWAHFSDEWQRLLDMNSPHYRHLDYFKMNEMRSLADRERCAWFYRVIEDHVICAMSCSVDVSALTRFAQACKVPPPRANDPDVYRSEIGNPYFPAFSHLVRALPKVQLEKHIDEPVDFIFDNDVEKTACIEAWDYVKASVTPEVLKLLGDTPMFRDDVTALPLQAADLYAYWVRKWETSGVHDGVEHLKFPWKISKPNLFRLEWKITESSLKKSFEDFNGPQYGARYASIDAAVRANKKPK